MNKRGFTLMEVLAVLLLLAVIASLAVPGIRAANFAIKNARAKTAAKKLIEGINNYRLATRGGRVSAFTFSGAFDTSCTVNINTGIPGNISEISVTQLAPCGFLSPKDFKNLPYTFYYGTSLPTFASSIPSKEGNVVLVALGNDQKKAGSKYYTASASVNNANYAIYIDQRLTPLEYEK